MHDRWPAPSRAGAAVELPEPQSDGDELDFLAVGRAVDRPRGHLGPAHHAPALGRADQGSYRALLGELRLAVWPRVTAGTGYPRPGSKRSPAPSPRWPPRQQRTPGRWPPDALAPTADDLPARMRGHTSRARLLARPPPWAGPALDLGKDSEDRRPGRAALIREAGPLTGVFHHSHR